MRYVRATLVLANRGPEVPAPEVPARLARVRGLLEGQEPRPVRVKAVTHYHTDSLLYVEAEYRLVGATTAAEAEACAGRILGAVGPELDALGLALHHVRKALC